MAYKRRVIMVPKNRRDSVNTVMERLGLGPDNMSVPITNRGGRNVTFYACNIRLTEEMFEALRREMPIGYVELNKEFRDVMKERNEEREKVG